MLVLVSVNCLNSDFIEGEELETAVSQLSDGHTRIIPIIISPCGWRFHKLFFGLQGLPEDMKPVSDWSNPDRAWTDVVESLAKIVEETRAEQAETAKKKRETEEQQRLATLTAEREAAEQKHQAETEKQRLADLAARKAEAERMRLEQEAERKRLRQAAKNNGEGNNTSLWVGFGITALLVLILMVLKPCKKPGGNQKDVVPTENSYGQSSDQSAFEQAKQLGTVPAWKDFISRYPKSPKIQEAKSQLSGLQLRVNKLLKEASDFIDVEEPGRAKKSIDDAEKLDPDNAELLKIKRSLK